MLDNQLNIFFILWIYCTIFNYICNVKHIYTVTIDGRPQAKVYTAFLAACNSVNIPYQYAVRRIANGSFRYVNASGQNIIILSAEIVKQNKGTKTPKGKQIGK